MGQFSTKHPKRTQDFFVKSFNDGLNQEVAPINLSVSSLTRCMNMKYIVNQVVTDEDGNSSKVVILKSRQGTEKISNTNIGSSILACYYFVAGACYIIATESKLYYLDGSFDPVEIGSISGRPTFTEFHSKLIIHDSGITKAWDGTTFETLTCLYKDESLGTGNGVITAYNGTVSHPAIKSTTLTITYTSGASSKTITSEASGALVGDVAASELMPNQVDRDFSGASAWANVDLNAYNETADLTITANAAGQYCTCPVASAPTTVGKVYRMTFSVANLVSTWTIKSYDGTQTIGTVSATGAQSFVWTATTTGGYRIVAVGATSSGDFDNFTLSGNAVNYTTGVYQFTCSGAPDNTTPVYAEYEKVSGAPKSKAGFVRASRLYMWGDSDNTSRFWYSGPNDEDAWDTTSSGGYLDVDPLDGYQLIGAVNFFSSVVLLKGNSLHRLDNFPGDNTFEVVPLLKEIGGVAYQTCLNDGNVISFLSKQGWLGLTSVSEYGDISKTYNFSKNFQSQITGFGNTYAYSEYNQIDKQLWLTLFQSTTQLSIIYVINMESGGQVGVYKFAFGHTCYKFINNEMLIGGSDGYLYRLLGDNTHYTDAGTSYAADTYVRGVMTDWGAGNNRKHNKYLYPHLYGAAGTSCTLNIYTNQDYDNVVYTKDITTTSGHAFIFDDGQDIYIYDMNMYISAAPTSERSEKISKKFNYQEVMFELTNIYGALGFEFYGIDFNGAMLGR